MTAAEFRLGGGWYVRVSVGVCRALNVSWIVHVRDENVLEGPAGG